MEWFHPLAVRGCVATDACFLFNQAYSQFHYVTLCACHMKVMVNTQGF